MKAIVGCIISGLLVSSALAQVADANIPPATATTASTATAPAAALSTTKKDKPAFEVNGPLVSPLKSKKFSEVPKRVFQSINPFAPSKTPPGERIPKVSPRAWTDVVGWGGQSAFPNEATHEPQMTLVTVSKPEKK